MMVCAAAGAPLAQGTPTGTLSGQVMDPAGLALPGVTVTVRSAVLQGERTTVTSANGDFIVPFLPPGDYTVMLLLSGFQNQQQTVQVKIAETTSIVTRLSLATVSETVTVNAQAPSEFAPAATISSTYRSDLVERLPVARTLNGAVLLAPNVTDNGPGGNIMISGALSFENLFLINGVVVNENLRAQAVPLFIEDAIQETKVSTGSISAEYGRFSGGVVNMITKSGGNAFSGSFRTTFTNDSWRALTPDPNDQTLDKIVPAYEFTVGGPILRDRLWYFGAGRFEKREENRTLQYTGINYPFGQDEKRYKGKLTYALTSKHTAKAAYTRKTLDETNRTFGEVIDLSNLYNRENPEDLLSLNYTGILTNKFFLEGQYSRRQLSFIGAGSQFTDLIKGTPIWDRSRGSVRFNSPFGCAVCGSGLDGALDPGTGLLGQLGRRRVGLKHLASHALDLFPREAPEARAGELDPAHHAAFLPVAHRVLVHAELLSRLADVQELLLLRGHAVHLPGRDPDSSGLPAEASTLSTLSTLVCLSNVVILWTLATMSAFSQAHLRPWPAVRSHTPSLGGHDEHHHVPLHRRERGHRCNPRARSRCARTSSTPPRAAATASASSLTSTTQHARDFQLRIGRARHRQRAAS